jgi:hypothetical protein
VKLRKIKQIIITIRTRTSHPMKKPFLLWSTLSLLLTVTAPVHALVIDAPHNSANSISCATCHSYSLWWQYSPTNQSSTPDHAAIVDSVCMTCHDGSHDQPLALTHSSAVVGTVSHGTWGVGCTDCHNPHSQEQLSWVGSGSSPYLVSGTITGVAYSDPPVDQTTITYSVATTNSNWPVAGSASSDPDWANKSVVNPDRGLILVHDTTNRANSYAIVSATPSQVVVKGRLDSFAIDPNHVDPQTQVQNPATCDTFGLIYGQLIKSTIAGKAVKFFDPNGGFVQAGAATTGICQVCHTQTSRYTASGVLPESPDTHADRAGGNCMGCHLHATGISRGSYHTNSSFAWDGNCALCHNAQGAAVNIVATTHQGGCGSCHVATTGGGPLTDGSPANGVDGTAVGAASSATCLACHITAPGLTASVIHHTSAQGYAAAGDCTHCHQDAPGKLAADHSTVLATSSNCTSCHAQTVGTTSGAPINPANAKIHDACTTCHETNGALKGPYGKAVAMPTAGGACEACHGAYFNSHTHTHTMRIGANDYFPTNWTPCSSCHSVQNWPSILGTHLGQCATCHSATRDIDPSAPTGTTVQMVIANPQQRTINCLDCHKEHFDPHNFTSDGNCADCHYVDYGMDMHSFNCGLCHVDPSGGGPRRAGDDGSAIDGVGTSSCTFCHNTTTYPPAVVHHDTVKALSGNCAACHYWTRAGNHATLVADSTACNSCHQATAGTTTGVPVNAADNKVHDACTTCHETNGALKGPYGKAINMPLGGGTCEICHGAYFNSHTAADHLAAVAPAPTCTLSSCHPAAEIVGTATAIPVNAADNKVHDACSTCHAANGTMLAPYGKAQAMPATGGTCVECHGSYSHPGYVHAMPTVSLCLSCHSATTAPYTANGDAHALQGCATCHNPTTGELLGSAVGRHNGASCEECHSTFSSHPFDHAPVVRVNSATTPTTANCVGCHAATVSPFVVAGEVHTIQGCATCHHPATGALIGSATGKTTGGECVTCHATSFNGHSHGNSHEVLMRPTDLTVGLACNTCHRQGGVSSGLPLFTNSWTGSDGILGLHQSSCTLCHDSTRAVNVAIGYTSVQDVILRGSAVACLECHADRIYAHSGEPSGDHNGDLDWTASCQSCHGAASTSSAAPQGEILAGVHGNDCGFCHLNGIGGNTLIGSATFAMVGVTPHLCTECHPGGFNGHSHGSGSNHDVLLRPWDLNQGAACNTCHRRGGTTSANPLFTNTWSGTDGILALHQGSCALCHTSTRTTDVAPGYSSVQDIIIGKVQVGCLDCHATHLNPHDFAWDGGCNSCHSGVDIVMNVHNGNCATCHLNPMGGGTRLSGRDGNALMATTGPDTCLTCHPTAIYPANWIHHDTNTAVNNNCATCHPAVDHSTKVQPVATCSPCHPLTTGTATGMPVDMANSRVHDSCLTCHTINTTTLAGQLIAPTGKRGVTAMAVSGTCTTCHTVAAATIHHTDNKHALIGECEYCHNDPRNMAGGTFFQETPPSGGIPTHLPCEECHVKPKRGTTVNGWTAATGQMTIYAFNEGGSHSTTNYSANFTRTTAHSGGHVIANTVGQINNWGVCFSCHDGSGAPGHAVRVNHFHAKPTALTATNLSCGTSGTAAFAPGREARNTIGNFDFFASTFRPASTRPGGSGSCKQTSDWTNSIKYGSTNFTATDTTIPDPWGSGTTVIPVFPVQPLNITTTPAADNVKVLTATWNGSNIVVTATNTNGCVALTATYNGSNQGFTGTSTCTATFAGTVVFTTSAPTVSVTTSNADGLGVNGFRINNTWP